MEHETNPLGAKDSGLSYPVLVWRGEGFRGHNYAAESLPPFRGLFIRVYGVRPERNVNPAVGVHAEEPECAFQGEDRHTGVT